MTRQCYIDKEEKEENQPGVVVSPVEAGDQDDQQKRRDLGGEYDADGEEDQDVDDEDEVMADQLL